MIFDTSNSQRGGAPKTYAIKSTNQLDRVAIKHPQNVLKIRGSETANENHSDKSPFYQNWKKKQFTVDDAIHSKPTVRQNVFFFFYLFFFLERRIIVKEVRQHLFWALGCTFQKSFLIYLTNAISICTVGVFMSV